MGHIFRSLNWVEPRRGTLWCPPLETGSRNHSYHSHLISPTDTQQAWSMVTSFHISIVTYCLPMWILSNSIINVNRKFRINGDYFRLFGLSPMVPLIIMCYQPHIPYHLEPQWLQFSHLVMVMVIQLILILDIWDQVTTTMVINMDSMMTWPKVNRNSWRRVMNLTL